MFVLSCNLLHVFPFYLSGDNFKKTQNSIGLFRSTKSLDKNFLINNEVSLLLSKEGYFNGIVNTFLKMLKTQKIEK